MRRRSVTYWLYPMLVCFLAFIGCSVEERVLYAPSAAPLTGDPGQENCGFELAEEPSEPPVNPCTDGTLVFGPETFVRAQGQPQTELRPFSAPEPGGVCILVQNSGVSAAWIGVDGVDIIKPNRFNPHISVLSAMTNVPAGEHELSVRLASKPGSELTVEVWFAPVDVTPRDKVVGDEGKVAVWNLFDAPDPFSPGDQDGVEDTTSLSAMVGVMHLGRARNSSYSLRYTFEIADQADCVQVRAIEGEVPLDPSVVLDGFMVEEGWDGTDDNGDPVAEGDYYYRLVAEVLREDPGGGIELIDYAVSRIQKVTVDNAPLNIKALDIFLEETNNYLATDEDGGLFIRWNYTPTPRHIWGIGVEFDMEEAGCLQANLFEKVRCYLAVYHDLYGYGDNTEHLLNDSITELKHGRAVVRFHQHLFGVPVTGADVVVTVTSSSDAITGIHSSFVRGLTTNPVESAEDLYPPPEITEDVLAEVESHIGSQLESHSVAVPAFIVDQLNKSTVAKPRFTFDVKTVDKLWYRVFMDLDGNIVEVKLMSMYSPDPNFGNHVIMSSWSHPGYTDDRCVTDDDCTAIHDERYSCYSDIDLLMKTCIFECTEHTDCYEAFDTDWNCIKTGGLKGFCQHYREEADVIEIFNLWDGPHTTNGWWDYYYNHYLFLRVERVLDDWTDFMWSILHRSSWDNCQGTTTFILQNCLDGSCRNTYDGNGVFTLTNLYGFDGNLNVAENLYSRYRLIGHEGGHSLNTHIVGTGDTCNRQEHYPSDYYCMGQDLADLMGALFARYRLPDDTWEEYDSNCPDSRCTLSAWGDQTFGLNSYPFADPFVRAYSHRSRYDSFPCSDEEVLETNISCSNYMDCPPYLDCVNGWCVGRNASEIVKNNTIWLRFARILAEGTSTFDRDRNDESLGFSFTGVGNDRASEIVYEAFTNLTEVIEPTIFAEILARAGYGHSSSNGLVTYFSLNAVGFPIGSYYLNEGIETDHAPRALTFSNWSQSDIKKWYIYKSKNTYHLMVRYHYGTNWTTNVISGTQTDTAPTAVVFNERLHIFWHERGTDKIRLIVVDEFGNFSAIQDLSGLEIETEGSFDVTIFNDDLYIGFVRPGSQHLFIARCDGDQIASPGYCTSNLDHWVSYGASKIKDMGLPTTHGVAIVAGSGVNGSEDDYLYAFLCDPTDRHLSVARIAEDDSAVDSRNIHYTYPSFQASEEHARGIEIRLSAFPSAYKYLYLVWNDVTDDRIYTSIMQNWNSEHLITGRPTEDRAWFTRSLDIGVNSSIGATFWRHNLEESIRHVYVSADDDYAYYNKIMGRY